VFELVKTASIFVYPLGFFMLLALAALGLLVAGRRRAGLATLSAGIVLLWIAAMPAVGNLAMWQLEKHWPDRPVAELPEADAIVVLGGAFSSGNGHYTYPSASGSVDRYWHAARLFRAGKAPLIVLSGGRQPHLTAGATEAEAGAQFLADMGVQSTALILDNEALTTWENAANVGAIAKARGFESLLIVTSASHMRRSMDTFRGIDAELIPAPTDFNATPDRPLRLRHFLPSAGALDATTRAVHEVVGRWFYRLKG
jgi:uncharacterized SAM-binding protein YcdF (DUF218 family)